MSADATLDLATGYSSLKRKVWAAMTSGQVSTVGSERMEPDTRPFWATGDSEFGGGYDAPALCLRRVVAVEGRYPLAASYQQYEKAHWLRCYAGPSATNTSQKPLSTVLDPASLHRADSR